MSGSWTDKDLQDVQEALKKHEDLIRPKLSGVERLMDILKDEPRDKEGLHKVRS